MIIRQIAILVFLALYGCAAPQRGSQHEYEGEQLLHNLPEGWVSGFSDRQGNIGIMEFIPAGQTVHQWDEMITTQVFFGGSHITAKGLQSIMAQRWEHACPGGTTKPIREGIENGYKFAFWLQHCGTNPATGLPEVTLFKGIEGNDSFYMLQKAWRRNPSTSEISEWTQFMSKAYVCDSRLPEQACPILTK